jgi:hypothetical protein
MMGCLRRVVLLVVLLVVLAAAWLFRDRLRTAWHDLRGTTEEAPLAPSQQLADRAESKLDALRDGSETSASLSALELESLLRYRYPGVLPEFLDSTRVELDGDQLRLRANIPIDKLPRVDGLEVAAFLPDTTEITVAGTLLPLDSGRVAFAVNNVSAARFPLPSRLIAPALERIGRRDEPGLPRDAIALPLPPGATAAYIRRDSLVLLARPAPASN